MTRHAFQWYFEHGVCCICDTVIKDYRGGIPLCKLHEDVVR